MTDTAVTPEQYEEVASEDDDADDDVLHLYNPLPYPRIVCGASVPRFGSPCVHSSKIWRGEARCPDCGRAICVYCRLLMQ